MGLETACLNQRTDKSAAGESHCHDAAQKTRQQDLACDVPQASPPSAKAETSEPMIGQHQPSSTKAARRTISQPTRGNTTQPNSKTAPPFGNLPLSFLSSVIAPRVRMPHTHTNATNSTKHSARASPTRRDTGPTRAVSCAQANANPMSTQGRGAPGRGAQSQSQSQSQSQAALRCAVLRCAACAGDGASDYVHTFTRTTVARAGQGEVSSALPRCLELVWCVSGEMQCDAFVRRVRIQHIYSYLLVQLLCSVERLAVSPLICSAWLQEVLCRCVSLHCVGGLLF
jgi:hypothetical protein